MEWCLHFFRNVQQKQNVEYSECDIMRLIVSSILGTNGKKWTNSITVNLCVCLVSQLCLTLCNPMHCSPPGSSVHGEPKNTGVGSLCLLQGICLTQELNQSFLHCRWTLYQLNLQGKPCVFFFFFFLVCSVQHAGSSFPKQGSDSDPLHWECRVLTTGQLGKSVCVNQCPGLHSALVRSRVQIES